MKEFDPNTARSMKTAHRIRMRFQLWAYEATFVEDVGGNCLGLSNLETAVGNLIDTLPKDEQGNAYMDLAHRDDAKRRMRIDARDDGPLDEDKMMELLVEAKVIEIVQTGKT